MSCRVTESNADRIRQMSDEELAHIINALMSGENAPKFCRDLPECDSDIEKNILIPIERCEQCLLHWLRLPAEQGK